MRNPSIYTATEIRNWRVDCGPKWIPARPCPFYGIRLFNTLRLAFDVLTGKYDALDWQDEPQDEDEVATLIASRCDKARDELLGIKPEDERDNVKFNY